MFGTSPPLLLFPSPGSLLTGPPLVCSRWATEDPNPTAKRSELVRLKEQGEAGIANALDPEFVQRIRELDELEGIVPPQEDAEEGVEEERQGREKRARIDAPPQQEREEVQPPLPIEAPPPAIAAAKSGILSADAVGSLQFMASLKARGGGGPVKVAVEQPKKTTGGLGGLAAYGSDDDSD